MIEPIIWIEVDGPPVFGDGLVQLVLGLQGDAEVVVVPRVFGIEFDGLLVFGDGPFHVVAAIVDTGELLVAAGQHEVIVGTGVIRFGCRRRLVRGR